MNFRLKKDWYIEDFFDKTKIYEAGHIFYPDDDGKYTIENPTNSGRTTLSFDQMLKSTEGGEEMFEPVDEKNVDLVIEEIADSEDDDTATYTCKMKNDIGHKIIGFPFENLKKVSDLIFFEGPILSHYKSGNDNLLFYWIDLGESHNRWLVIKVEEEQLARFLRKKINLKVIVLESVKSFIFITDIDSDSNFDNTYLIKSFDGIEEYIPEEDSYFKLSIPPIYENLITKYQENY